MIQLLDFAGGLLAVGLLKYVADPDTQLAQITYWTMGSLAKISASGVIAVAPVKLIAMGILLFLRWRMNLLAIGEAEAHALGVQVGKLRGIAIVCATVLTASSICIAGTVGWIGLVIPHLGRLLVGADNKHLLPASLFMGGGFLMLIDTCARNISGSEIPLSILTGFIGTPVFLWLMVKQKSKV